MSFARETPSRRLSRCVPPALQQSQLESLDRSKNTNPGIMASRVSGSPIFVAPAPALSFSFPSPLSDHVQLTSHPQIARQRKLQSSSQGHPINRRNSRDWQRRQLSQHLPQRVEKLGDLGRAHRLALLQIRSSAENFVRRRLQDQCARSPAHPETQVSSRCSRRLFPALTDQRTRRIGPPRVRRACRREAAWIGRSWRRGG